MPISLNRVLFFFFLSILCIQAETTAKRPRLAVCVGGQVSRLMPEHLYEGFVQFNTDYEFDFFYNLQRFNSSRPHIVYNTDPNVTFHPTKYAYLSEPMVKHDLYQIIRATEHSKVISVNFHDQIDLPEIEQEIGYELKLFELPQLRSRATQATILNMYRHQERCISQIKEYEIANNFTYNYVVSTREDVIIFLRFNLTKILGILDEKVVTAVAGEDGSRNESYSRKCNMVMKGCANFKGFNMRLFIYDRLTAENILSNRFNFARLLLKQKKELVVPEVFELEMARHYQYQGCPINVNDYAITAVRHTKDGKFCYPFWEIFKCLPHGIGQKIHRLRCEYAIKNIK